MLVPYEAKVIVVGPLPKEAAAPESSFASAGDTVATLDGDWSLAMNGKHATTGLIPWEAMGTSGFSGPATYRRQFTAAATPRGKRVYLEIGDVHDYAKVTLNGMDLGARAWGPYRWDVTGALKKGPNDLQIVVNATPAGRGGPGGAPSAATSTAGPAAPADGLATAAPAGGGASGTGGQRRRQGTGAGSSAPAAGAPPAPTGGGRAAAPAVPATSGLLGPVTLVAR